MEYKFKVGDKVRVLDVPTVEDGRREWIGKELTLQRPDIGGKGWEVPAWSVEEPDCYYRFRESEMVLAGPIRTETVTVRRLEPGVYGRLWVGGDIEGYASVAFTPMLSDDDWSPSEGQSRSLSAPELRELARVALEIAEYLDAQ